MIMVHLTMIDMRQPKIIVKGNSLVHPVKLSYIFIIIGKLHRHTMGI